MIKYLVSLLLLSHICNISAIGETSFSLQEDSLNKALQKTSSANARISILTNLSKLTLDKQYGNNWLKLLLREAKQQGKIDAEDWAIRNLARYYYNYNDMDSVAYYATLSDSITKVANTYSNEYYDTQTFLCQAFLWKGHLEKAADMAIRLYSLAHENKNENGIICSCEVLGLTNQRIGNDSTAISFLTEGLNLQLKQKNGYRYVVQLLSSIIESDIRLNRFSDAHIRLKQFDSMLKQILNGDFGTDPSFPFKRMRQYLDAYYINLYAREKKLEKTKEHIDRLNTHEEELDNVYIGLFYHQGLAEYYRLIKNYSLAIKEMTYVLEIDSTPSMIKLKADILYEAGNTADAAILYKQALEKTEEINTQAFVRQLSQLHSLHNMNNLELQVKELQVKELELASNQQHLKWATAFVVILIFILILGSFSYSHTRKLKNALLMEKQALLESEKALRIAGDRAKESDRLKSLFLSNMSHEIRTPLNAISGFAQLLDEETEDGDERKDYTHVITDNASLLLNLVNDILDISRLESEKYRFTFAPENLAECCRSALTSVEHRVKEGVQLVFKPEDDTFLLTTDKLRLKQVFINLVGNATKFTEAGSIELAYTIDKVHELVRFTVTDTGCGIPKDKQEAIFDRFEKLNECVQGTGLGLSICRIIAERFEGEVTLDTEYTGGARFIFTHSLNL